MKKKLPNLITATCNLSCPSQPTLLLLSVIATLTSHGKCRHPKGLSRRPSLPELWQTLGGGHLTLITHLLPGTVSNLALSKGIPLTQHPTVDCYIPLS